MSAFRWSKTRRDRAAKVLGSDVELGNMIFGLERANGTGFEASRALLRQVHGLPSPRSYATHAHSGYSAGGGSAYRDWGTPGAASRFGHGQSPQGAGYLRDGNGDWQRHDPETGHRTGRSWQGSRHTQYPYAAYSPQDCGRKYLASNGGCVYIDLNHLEVCTPEVLSARDYVAAYRAMLHIARDAMRAANEELPAGQRLVVLANNSDGQSHSYGSHLNFLITRQAWNDLFERLFPSLFYLAAFQASSIVITGQGKVGAENGQPPIDYQISGRADFIETLLGPQTTFHRPLINTRDEPHCGRWTYDERTSSLDQRLARLHCIFYDNTLAQVGTYLKVGLMALILAMIEAGFVNPDLILADPVAALHTWSHDPDLHARAHLANGNKVTAVELQRAFLEDAKAFLASEGGFDTVPEADTILSLWEDTVAKLEARAFDALAPRLDWILKRSLLERTLRDRPQLSWRSPEIKHLDLIYSSLDEDEGLYWACERSGLMERVVSGADVERFVHQPPDDTRAWTRAMLLRAAGRGRVEDVNWDEVRVAVGRDSWGCRQIRTVSLADPVAFTRAKSEPLFQRAETFSALLDSFE